MDLKQNIEIDRKKRYLKRYRKNKACIAQLKNKLLFLNDRIEGLKAANISGMPRGGQPVRIEDLLSDKMILEKRIESLKVKGEELKVTILAEIDTLDDPRYTDVLERFFIDGLDFDTIADQIGYTERHVTRLYSEAIRLLVENDALLS